MARRQRIVEQINKRIYYIIIISIILCGLYIFFLYSSYRFYSIHKHNDVILLFFLSLVFNFLGGLFFRNMLFRLTIITIVINILLSIILLFFSVQVKSFSFFIEGITFFLFVLFASGNWLLPFIIYCFRKLRLKW